MSSLIDAVNNPSRIPFKVTNLVVTLDGKRQSLIQNIVIAGGIDRNDDLFLTVDGKKLVTEKTEAIEGLDGKLIDTTRIKTITLEDGSQELVTTTLGEEAIAAGGTRVIVKDIEVEDGKIKLNLMTFIDQD